MCIQSFLYLTFSPWHIGLAKKEYSKKWLMLVWIGTSKHWRCPFNLYSNLMKCKNNGQTFTPILLVKTQICWNAAICCGCCATLYTKPLFKLKHSLKFFGPRQRNRNRMRKVMPYSKVYLIKYVIKIHKPSICFSTFV